MNKALDTQSILDALQGWSDVERVFNPWVGAAFDPSMAAALSRCGASRELCRRGLRHPRAAIRTAAAAAGTTFPEVIVVALRDRHHMVRRVGAASTVAPHGLLAALVHDPSTVVRRTVAGNRRLPESAVVKLLDDADMSVATIAAAHPLLSMAVQCRLADDPRWEIRRVVAGRPVPLEVLDRLAADPVDAVAEAVASNVTASSAALHLISRRTKRDEDHVAVIAHALTTTEDRLWSLSQISNHADRCGVARSTRDSVVLRTLAKSDDHAVRVAVLSNSIVSLDIFMNVPIEAPIAEHRVVVRHPRATWAACRRLAEPYLRDEDPERRKLGIELLIAGLHKPDAPRSIPDPVMNGTASPADILRFLEEAR